MDLSKMSQLELGVEVEDLSKKLVQLKQLSIAKTLVLTDALSEKVELIFHFGRAKGDDEKLFELSQSISIEHGARIIINGGDGRGVKDPTPGISWPGVKAYLTRFAELGVPCSNILFTKPALHTGDESDSMVEVACQLKVKSAAYVARGHQLLRGMQCLLASMKKYTYWLRVYPICPRPDNWLKKAPGSQGLNDMERLGHIELEDTMAYQYSDPASVQEVIEYLLNGRLTIE